MPAKGQSVAVYKTIDGVRHKQCGGVEGGHFVPLTGFYTIKSGRNEGIPRSKCIECERRYHGVEALVPIERVHLVWIEELIRRLGVDETYRRIGRTQQWLWQVRARKINHFQKRTLRAVIIALKQVRDANEVRHRDSIKHGAYLRGREEKVPTAKDDYYKVYGDSDNEYKRQTRNDRVREREREGKRRRRQAQLTPTDESVTSD